MSEARSGRPQDAARPGPSAALGAGARRSVVVIGGGTGSFNVLAGLRPSDQVKLTSIVTMTDSGGDSGRLRSEFKVLPPGDIRRCLVALSEESSLLRDLFNFRFDDDPLRGRQLGNLLVLALARILGSEREAINAIHRLLNIKGRVLPVSWDQVHLCAELANGQLIEEEAHIDVPKHDPSIPIRRVFLKPEASPNPEALVAMADSDFIVMAPGDLYTSSIPNLLVRGVPEALYRSRAKLVCVLNLMTKRGETLGYPASRHIEEIIHYGGRVPEAVLVHRGDVPEEMAQRYLAEEARPVEIDEPELRALGVPLIWSAAVISTASKARHDPQRTGTALLALFAALEVPPSL
jgi:uncharacterized cofD-like protein